MTDVPPSLHFVEVVVGTGGGLTVTVDGVEFRHEPVPRPGFASELDEIVHHHRSSLRVEVRRVEKNAHRTGASSLDREPRRQGAFSAGIRQVGLFALSGEGFFPGEEVAVAPILGCAAAATDGQLRSVVEVSMAVDELLVCGRVSGTVLIVPATE